MKKRNYKITQTKSGSYVSWVSDGIGHDNKRKKAKITGNSPEEVIQKAEKWFLDVEEQKRCPYTVKDAMTQYIESLSSLIEPMDIRFHDLRHIFASTTAMLNIPEKYAMEMGGWSTPDIYKNVYQETFDSERVKADTIIDTYFNNIIEKDKGTHE